MGSASSAVLVYIRRKPTGAVKNLPKLIVLRPFLGIAQNLVSFVDFLKPGFIAAAIGVKLVSFLAISFLNFFLGSFVTNP